MQNTLLDTTIPSARTVAIIGSRNINDYDFMRKKFQALLDRVLEMKHIVSGGARGNDSISKRISNGIQDGIRKARAMGEQAFFFPN